MGLAQSVRQSLLNHFFGKSTLTAPTIYVGLSSTTPTSTGGNVTEPSSGSYARKQSAASDWNTATAADPSVLTNANELAFTQATGDWASGSNMTHAVFYSAASGGTFLGFGVLATPKPVLNGDTARFSAGQISVSIGDE